MTKDIIVAWVIIQLFIVGLAAGAITADINNKEYDCTEERVSKIGLMATGAIFPIVLFMSDATMEKVDEYCKK